MKIVELLNSIQLPITNEEADLLGKFDNGTGIAKRDLDPREEYIANQLVNKEILLRRYQDGRTTYTKKI